MLRKQSFSKMIHFPALFSFSTALASLNIGGTTKRFFILAAPISCMASHTQETPVITFTDIQPYGAGRHGNVHGVTTTSGFPTGLGTKIMACYNIPCIHRKQSNSGIIFLTFITIMMTHGHGTITGLTQPGSNPDYPPHQEKTW